MEKFIIPEMIKQMQEDGYKVSVKKDGETKELDDNKEGAKKEYTFDMEDMGWRSQLGDKEFGIYARKALHKAKNPFYFICFVKMYQDDIIKQRDNYDTLLSGLKR